MTQEVMTQEDTIEEEVVETGNIESDSGDDDDEEEEMEDAGRIWSHRRANRNSSTNQRRSYSRGGQVQGAEQSQRRYTSASKIMAIGSIIHALVFAMVLCVAVNESNGNTGWRYRRSREEYHMMNMIHKHDRIFNKIFSAKFFETHQKNRSEAVNTVETDKKDIANHKDISGKSVSQLPVSSNEAHPRTWIRGIILPKIIERLVLSIARLPWLNQKDEIAGRRTVAQMRANKFFVMNNNFVREDSSISKAKGKFGSRFFRNTDSISSRVVNMTEVGTIKKTNLKDIILKQSQDWNTDGWYSGANCKNTRHEGFNFDVFKGMINSIKKAAIGCDAARISCSSCTKRCSEGCTEIDDDCLLKSGHHSDPPRTTHNESEVGTHVDLIRDEHQQQVTIISSVLKSSSMAVLALNVVLPVIMLTLISVKELFFGVLTVTEFHRAIECASNYHATAFLTIACLYSDDRTADITELFLWVSWFAIVAALKVIGNLAKSRFETLEVFSSEKLRERTAMIVLLCSSIGFSSFLLFLCSRLFVLGGSLHYALILANEPLIINFDCLHSLFKYCLHFREALLKQNLQSTNRGRLNMRNGENYHRRYDREWYFRSLCLADLLYDLLSMPVSFWNLLHIWSLHGVKVHLLDGLLLWRVKSITTVILSKLFRWYRYQRTLRQLQSRFVAASCCQLMKYNDECAICKDELSTGRILPCGHIFHLTCLQKWASMGHGKNYSSCPICRTPFDKNGTPSNRWIADTTNSQVRGAENESPANARPGLDQSSSRFQRPTTLPGMSQQHPEQPSADFYFISQNRSIVNATDENLFNAPRRWYSALPQTLRRRVTISSSSGDSESSTRLTVGQLHQSHDDSVNNVSMEGNNNHDISVREGPYYFLRHVLQMTGSETVIPTTNIETISMAQQSPSSFVTTNRRESGGSIPAMSVQQSDDPSSNDSTYLSMMAAEVQNVLPNARIQDILSDLRRTRSTAITVNNLLDNL